MKKLVWITGVSVIVLLVFSVIGITIFATQQNGVVQFSEASYDLNPSLQTLSYITSASDRIVIAQYIGAGMKDQESDSFCYQFRVKEALYGTIEEEEINVYTYQVSMSFEKEKQYILILSVTDTLFWPIIRYGLIQKAYIPVHDFSKSTIRIVDKNIPIKELVGAKSVEEAKTIFMTAQKPARIAPKTRSYTFAEDLPEIVQESKFVFEVKVIQVGEGHHGFDNVDVDVISVVFQKPEDRNTWVVAAKGKLKVGQSYMITVNHSESQ